MSDVEQANVTQEQAAVAITAFLHLEGLQIAREELQERLRVPTMRSHPELGAVHDFRDELGNFWISSRGNVIYYSGASLPSHHEPVGSEKGFVLARDFVRRHVADFESRNFAEEHATDAGSITARWSEGPRTGIETAVFPNWVEVVVQVPSGRVSRFSASDLRLARTTAPQFSEAQARAAIKGMFERAAIEDIDLILVPRGRDGAFLTVWNALVMTAAPEGPTVRRVVIDADTGELVTE